MVSPGDSIGSHEEGIPAFLAALLSDERDHDDVHLCAICDTPITDPLEECPVCAANFDSEVA